MFFLGANTVNSKNKYVAFFHELLKSLFSIIVISLIIFLFKKQLYYNFIRGNLEIENDKISCIKLNEFNDVWSCKLPVVNFYDSSIKNRVYEITATVENYNFTKCLNEEIEGVSIIKNDSVYSCKYNLSLDGHNELNLPFTVSGGKEIPHFEISED